jgi:hypothetical protein
MDSLSEEQLHVVCMDFFLPAITTAAAVLNFSMAFLLNYPAVHTKMQEELDIEVGRDRLPTLDDRARLVNENSIPASRCAARLLLTAATRWSVFYSP